MAMTTKIEEALDRADKAAIRVGKGVGTVEAMEAARAEVLAVARGLAGALRKARTRLDDAMGDTDPDDPEDPDLLVMQEIAAALALVPALVPGEEVGNG
jgi:hypothetical protein